MWYTAVVSDVNGVADRAVIGREVIVIIIVRLGL